jgi:O-antigen/teichoic acid export membrane protein
MKLVNNTIIYTFGNILPKISGFVLLPLYTYYLSPSEYGIVMSMQAFMIVMQIFITLGIERSLYRIYYDYPTQQEKAELIGTVSVLILTIALIVTGLLLCFKNQIGLVYKNIPFSPYYIYTFIIAIMSAGTVLPKIYLQIIGSAKSYVLLSIIQTIVVNLFALYYVIKIGSGASGYLEGQMYGMVVQLPIYVAITWKISIFKIRIRYAINAMKFSIPMIPTLISAWAMSLVDRMFIERYYSLEDVGIYSLAFKVSSIVILVSTAMSKAYSPYYFSIANTKSYSDAKNMLSKTNTLYVLIVLLFCGIISLFSNEIISILFEHEYSGASEIIPLLMLSFAFSQSLGVVNLSYYQSKNTSKLMIIMLASAVLNITANYILTPQYGMVGASLAKIISYVSLFIVQYYNARKYYYIPFKWNIIISLFLLLIIIYMVFIVLNIGSMVVVIGAKIFILAAVLTVLYAKYKKEIIEMFDIE